MEIAVPQTKGGEFLLQNTNTETLYSVEYRSEEAQMIQETVRQFLSNEIFSRLEVLETPEGMQLTPQLLKQCGTLGLLGLEVPETLGGSDLSLTNTLHFVEEMGKSYSFGGAIGLQTSIGISPIVHYGSSYIKEKYLPHMITGDLLSAFCLTEPNAGSDANSGKTRATMTAEGNYVITGQKAWISNGGLAQLYIVFAKIEDDKNLSAFVVEKAFGGTTVGAEEQKMGLSGWSTTPLFFDKVLVPKENLLGERNQGFKIALNTLNTGRIKLGVSALGISKMTANYAVNYAIAREQFGQSISDFGAIKEKLAQYVH
ncbi:acyl-CoA dehydrogenase family protein [Lacinutrix neustonica]|uniref:Acyl-CoA dehydrogenase family protein n=1 Tax=Lacinutrix neustonica TaxID=2980107 RepID=A0A9E8MXT7_9FLAO|nr:acyl-CoA dehydrogenase family protein [Lacinutrix neustonica]WAC02517.1 acyl-CoA dehydrogenase family protein [Lacinutrix neustonica]